MTKEQGDQILRELRAIRLLLERQQPRPQSDRPAAMFGSKVTMRVEADWHALGRADAPVAMVEFGDLVCPFCRRFDTTTFPQIKTTYIDTGKVRFVSRDFPLKMHPDAFKAAEAARCAGDQGKFWELRDAILASNGPPTPDAVSKQASQLGLDPKVLQSCVESGKYRAKVESDHAAAEALNLRGTPVFIIGRVKNGRLDGVVIPGARPYETFQQQIDKALAGRAPANAPGAPEAPAALNQ